MRVWTGSGDGRTSLLWWPRGLLRRKTLRSRLKLWVIELVIGASFCRACAVEGVEGISESMRQCAAESKTHEPASVAARAKARRSRDLHQDAQEVVRDRCAPLQRPAPRCRARRRRRGWPSRVEAVGQDALRRTVSRCAGAQGGGLTGFDVEDAKEEGEVVAVERVDVKGGRCRDRNDRQRAQPNRLGRAKHTSNRPLSNALERPKFWLPTAHRARNDLTVPDFEV